MIDTKIQFVFQYTNDFNQLQMSNTIDELSKKVGCTVDIEFKDIIPLESLISKPAYGKYSHIETIKRPEFVFQNN